MATQGTKPEGKNPNLALEEELEESSVTDLRHGLLPTIDRIRQNPALRVMIRKHGSPSAVLMSVQTYEALKKLANLTLQKADAMSREEQIEAAFQRLEAEGQTPEISVSEANGSMPSASLFFSNQGSVGSDFQTPVFQVKGEAKAIIGQIEQKLRELDNALGA